MVSYDHMYEKATEAFNSGKTLDLSFRKSQLRALRQMYVEQEEEMIEALSKDMRKPRHEALLCDVVLVVNEIDDLINNLEEYAAPEKPGKPLANLLDELYIYKDPYGIVLIMSPWNYPLNLLLVPLAGAIAAGNVAVRIIFNAALQKSKIRYVFQILKPSELTPHSASLVAKFIPQYLDNECYHVVCGGIEETTALLNMKFDYIFYTGSTRVGQIIHQAANKHLTPCTLELGGKSPCFIDENADMERTTKRLLWGKFLNNGQTCIAPDYIMCTKEVQSKFIEMSKQIVSEWYGEYPKTTPDLCRVVNRAHFDRLLSYLKSGKIVIGGGYDADELFIEPTIMIDVHLDDRIMNDEIFGPILPIINVKDAIEAVQFIRERPKPLASYIFTNDKEVQELFIKRTTAGGMCINETILHFTVDTLPFGGVGLSGLGAYHGKYSLDSFSHKKSCLKPMQSCDWLSEALRSLRYPPFTTTKSKILFELMKKREFPRMFKYFPYLIIFTLGNITCFLYYLYAQQMHAHTENDE